MLNYSDMDYIKPARINGNRENIYIDTCTNQAFIDARKALNFSTIDLTGVNNICIHRFNDDTFYIFAVGGYTPEDGIFTKQYKYQEV